MAGEFYLPATNARPRRSPQAPKRLGVFASGLVCLGLVDTLWISPTAGNLKTGGGTASRVAPVILCGQNALAMPWAKMPTPTFRDQTDYQFIKGAGIKMCYGVAKIFQKDSASDLTQWGVVNGFFSAAADA